MNETISFVQSYLSGHAIQTRRQRLHPMAYMQFTDKSLFSFVHINVAIKYYFAVCKIYCLDFV